MIAMFTPSFSQCAALLRIQYCYVYSMPPPCSKFPQLILAKVFYTILQCSVYYALLPFLLCKWWWWWWWRYLICYQQYHHHIHQGASFFFPSSQRLPLLFFQAQKGPFCNVCASAKKHRVKKLVQSTICICTPHTKSKKR